MRIILSLLLITSVSKSYAEFPSQSEVRLRYVKAAFEKESCKNLILLLESYNENNKPLLAGYKACAKIIMANYVINPISKYSNFSEGIKLLEKCIENQNENIELRFLRFTVQTKAPSFLGYVNSIQDDKLFLLNSISIINDLELKQFIIDFFLKSNYLTTKEKQNLEL